MKSIFFLFFLTFSIQISAQQRHYILLQSDGGSSFTVKLNDQTFQSSSAGHMIIPRLYSNRYSLQVNIDNGAKSVFFSCNLTENDLAYTLKNFGEKGWGLQNMSTKEVMLAATQPISDAGVSGSSVFSDMLMEVADDTLLNKKTIPVVDPIVKQIPIENATIANSAEVEIQHVIDSVAQLQDLQDKAEQTIENITQEISPQEINDTPAASIFPTNELLTDTVVVDVHPIDINQQNDINQPRADSSEITKTIAPEIFVPIDTVKQSLDNPFYNAGSTTEPKKEVENKETQQPVAEKEVVSDKIQTEQPPTTDTKTIIATQAALRPGCKEMYADESIEKLKRKVVNENSIDAMIQVILKATSNKCLTTAQVKTLGGLFLSDEGRYSLYDALYNRVYDYGMYSILEKQIVDPYYKTRFLALLR